MILSTTTIPVNLTRKPRASGDDPSLSLTVAAMAE